MRASGHVQHATLQELSIVLTRENEIGAVFPVDVGPQVQVVVLRPERQRQAYVSRCCARCCCYVSGRRDGSDVIAHGLSTLAIIIAISIVVWVQIKHTDADDDARCGR